MLELLRQSPQSTPSTGQNEILHGSPVLPFMADAPLAQR